MPKTHSKTQQTNNRGLARLAMYCANHDPQLIFRETSTDDIGIDGEIELIDSDDHATGEIIKIQLKSTESHKSYIKNETKNEFAFDASKDDLEYWNSVTNDVLLIVFDNRDGSDILYARSVKGIDASHAGRTTIPVRFDKTLDCLRDGEHSFIDHFSKTASRKTKAKKRYVPQQEKLTSNLIQISLPATLFVAPILEEYPSPEHSSQKTASKRIKKQAPLTFSESEHAERIRRKLGAKDVFLSDWIACRNSVLTFRDFRDTNTPFKSIVDVNRTEKYRTNEFLYPFTAFESPNG